jgi:hypothetical protein
MTLMRQPTQLWQVVSFHEYGDVIDMRRTLTKLKALQRGLICSEYMARGTGSTFDPVLGYLRSEGAWAYNWGFVAGRSQTNYPWDSWNFKYTASPAQWHHDVLHLDGSPFAVDEVRHGSTPTHDPNT